MLYILGNFVYFAKENIVYIFVYSFSFYKYFLLRPLSLRLIADKSLQRDRIVGNEGPMTMRQVDKH